MRRKGNVTRRVIIGKVKDQSGSAKGNGGIQLVVYEKNTKGPK